MNSDTLHFCPVKQCLLSATLNLNKSQFFSPISFSALTIPPTIENFTEFRVSGLDPGLSLCTHSTLIGNV